MKLVIEISEGCYEYLKDKRSSHIITAEGEAIKAVILGRPLDEIIEKMRTEIEHERDSAERSRDGTFEVEGCGMGMCLIQVEAIKRIYNNGCNSPFEPFDGLGEDLAFCYRARQIGLTIKANAYIPLGHIGTAVYTKADYRS